MNLRVIVGSLAAVLVLGIQVAGAGATTFSAKVTPSGAGTSAQPKAHTIDLQVDKIKQGVDGNPTVGLYTLAQALPAEFASQFAKFGTCDPKLVVNTNSVPKCPANSVIATGNAGAYAPSLRLAVASDYGYIYKIGPTAVRGWYRTSKPFPAGFVVDGSLSQAASPFGPVMSWDLKPEASGSATAGIPAYTSSFSTVYRPGNSIPADSAKAKKRRARALRSCMRKARKNKHGKALVKAKRRCNRKYKAKKKASSTASPFMSTGCVQGTWGFEARLSYQDGSSETLASKVGCTTGTGGSGQTGSTGLPCIYPLPCPSSLTGRD
jgi:hypothetical protein